MNELRWLGALVLVAGFGCGDSGGGEGDADTSLDDVSLVPDSGVGDPGEPEAETDAVGDVAVDGGGGDCFENAAGELPDDIEWLILDGNADALIAMSDRRLNPEVEGQFGEVFDINAIAYFGANGFYLDGPAVVVGAQARFANVDPGGAAQQAVLWAWPDFSSDGYVFDIDAPYGRYSRCITTVQEAEWVTFAFPAPIEVTQPLHVFVGTSREDLTPVPGESIVYPYPELLFEDFQNEAEPYYAGIRWPDFDDEQYYQGTVSPWFTWQVRLALVRPDEPEPERPFAVTEGFRASGRVAWGDYDADGDDDLMTNGPTLYRNDDGALADVTAVAIPGGVSGGTNGGVWGDYDNDGCLDYFGQGGADVLLRSACDGTFVEVVDSGIDDSQSVRDCDGDGEAEHSPTEGAAWIDYDGDGLLDLYLANYECSSEHDYFQNYVDRLFRNRGDGTFEAADDVDLVSGAHAGRGATPADFDIDGDVDLLVSNYRLDPNLFYVNDRGELEDEARLRGVQGTAQQGAYGHTIGSVFGDIDGDADFDLIQANLAHPFFYHFSDKTAVLINDGYGVFTDEAADRGIYYRETHSNPTLFDADDDGDLDLFITSVYVGRDSDFYENDGAGNFTLRNYESGLVVQNGWGSAAADVDNDGDVDLVAYDLFENVGPPDGHWVQVRAVGVGTNTSAIGAVVEVEAGGSVQVRQVSGGSGTGCQDSMYLHFGLGERDRVDAVRVHFPYGDTVEVRDPDADARLWVYSDGESGQGWAPPR